MAEMSFEEFAGPKPGGSSRSMSFEDFTQGKVAGPSSLINQPRSESSLVLEGTLSQLKRTGGEGAALADFVLGIPAFLIGTGAQLGGTIFGAASGVPLSPKQQREQGVLQPFTAFSVGREAGAQVGERLGSPLHKLMQMFESGEAYEQAKTTKGMEKFSKLLEDAGVWTENASGGRISRDSIPMMAEVLMAGATGIGSGKPQPAIAPHIQKALREQGQKLREQAEVEAQQTALTPAEFQARVPVQQQINDLLGIRTPAEQAKITRQRRKDIAQAFRDSESAEVVGEGGKRRMVSDVEFRAEEAIEERIASQQRLMEEAPEGRIETQRPVGQAEVLGVLTKPGEARTPEDLLLLRQARGESLPPRGQVERRAEHRMPDPVELQRQLETAKATGDEGRVARLENQLKEAELAGKQADQLIYGKQKGSARPEALGLLGAAGLGGVLGSVLDDETLRGATLGGATGLAAVLPLLGRGTSVPSRMRQAGAVKAPGGMWHPEAVERLAAPLKDKLVPDGLEAGRALAAQHPTQFASDGRALNLKEAQRLADDYVKPIEAKVTSMVRNYLNRYAGTEKDPLKDVEIPYGDRTSRWEDAIDTAIHKGTLGSVEAASLSPETIAAFKSGKITKEEPVFSFKGGSGGAFTNPGVSAVTSYLSHVGDYLRQNVDPAKLQQYDLVRAVRETAENDRRVAREMEKAAAASSKDLPVYKAYPDGYRWVELKLPEKLTEEQGKGVRKDPTNIEGEKRLWVALDAQGKPIKNSYTGDPTYAKTPEEAWLAGRLAEEGNQMGHCVGGYCGGVASGESRIFSLRDPKGLSHVTVEVMPRVTEVGAERLGAAVSTFPQDISQIKGKQNRAPEAKYLPYVQDFVKEGKWGEVGDLENTGLKEFDYRAWLDKEPVFVEKLKKEFGDSRFLTQEQFVKADKMWSEHKGDTGQTIGRKNTEIAGDEMRRLIAENPNADPRLRPRERGFIDQRLVVGLAGLGLGGVLGSQLADDPGSGALLGALAGASLALPGTARRFKQAVEGVDYLVGTLSTRIGNVSPALKLRARTFEMRNLEESHRQLHRVAPLMKELNKLPPSKQKALNIAALNGDIVQITELMKGNRELVAAWNQARNVMNELGAELVGKGRFRTLKDDYIPRLVKDVEGLKAALGVVERTRLEKALKAAGDAAMRSRGTPLTNIEQSAIINREIDGIRRSKGSLPGFAKARKVQEITEALLPYYHTPSESLYAYVRTAVQDLETARFFGRDLVQRKQGSGEFIDVDASVGNIIGRELAEGKIKPEQVRESEELFKSRFRAGERSSNAIIQDVRNLGNMGLLGNLVAGVTQGADALLAIYAQDLRSTITAVARQLSGNERVTAKDFGLADHVAEEFASTSKTANALNRIFKYSGFSGIDRFGKTTQLNAAFDRYQRLAGSARGVARIREKYGDAYGPEFPQLVGDLAAGRLSERVRSLLFSELSDMQPISRSEMPQGYLNHPNGRIMYMLKTFMIKQMDVVRRDVYNEFKKGNRARAIKNLTEYGLVLGLAGATTDMVKDWLLGRPVSFGLTDVLENALKTFGWSEYVRDKIAQGHPVEATAGMIAPPYKMMDDIIRRDPKAVQYVPLIGKLYYSWELGGREEAEIREARKARKAGREAELSGRAEAYQEQKREKLRAKREAEGR